MTLADIEIVCEKCKKSKPGDEFFVRQGTNVDRPFFRSKYCRSCRDHKRPTAHAGKRAMVRRLQYWAENLDRKFVYGLADEHYNVSRSDVDKYLGWKQEAR